MEEVKFLRLDFQFLIGIMLMLIDQGYAPGSVIRRVGEVKLPL
jgi:hypothetical protein